MKVSITSNDRTYSVETKHDDMTMCEIIEVIKGLLVSCGFHARLVDESLPNDEPWFTDDTGEDKY